MAIKTKMGDIQGAYNLGERDFTKLQLRRIDLRNANLRGINLQGSDLSYADLRNADLSKADLRNCCFNGANFTDATLTGANLQGAHLTKAYLIKANLSKVNFQEAYLTDSLVTGANFTKADLCGTCLNGIHISGATFRSAIYDSFTKFDKGFEPEKFKMELVLSFKRSVPHKVTIKVTIADVITNFEEVIKIASHYLGGTITVKNFEQSRPDIKWLQSFIIDKTGKITFTGSVNDRATMIQLKWLEKWSNSFIQKCSLIIQDLPNIIEEKHLSIQSLIEKNVA